MHLLIDADSLCYRAGFVVNGEGQEALACWQLDQIIHDILQETGADTHKLYISGADNFRYKVYPEYKGNRVEMVRPLHLQAMREHLVVKWKAAISEGREADDDCGIALYNATEDTVLGGIDKDLLCIPGNHYNYVKKTYQTVSELDGMRWFFVQMICGDKGDNIPGYDGKMRPKVPKFLQPHIDYLYETEDIDDMLAHVFTMYGQDWKRFNLSATCLWIWRKEDDNWQDWQNKEFLKNLKEEATMVEHGQPEDLIPLSRPFSGVVADAGPQSTLS